MGKQPLIKQDGVITEALSNAMFKVKLENGHEILATISGKMRMNYIKILPGDRIKLEMSPYDLSKGRIVPAHSANRPSRPIKIEPGI